MPATAMLSLSLDGVRAPATVHRPRGYISFVLQQNVTQAGGTLGIQHNFHLHHNARIGFTAGVPFTTNDYTVHLTPRTGTGPVGEIAAASETPAVTKLPNRITLFPGAGGTTVFRSYSVVVEIVHSMQTGN